MTPEELRDCNDPLALIDWLSGQGRFQPLWDFTLANGVRIRNLLPGAAFRRVVRTAELIAQRDATWIELDVALNETAEALKQLEARLELSKRAQDRERVRRRILLGRAVLAFGCKGGSEAAAFISQHLLEWAADPVAEAKLQAELLRELVADTKAPDEGRHLKS